MSNKKIKLVKDYSYPETKDDEFLTKIFKKREFYYHKVVEREKLKHMRTSRIIENKIAEKVMCCLGNIRRSYLTLLIPTPLTPE